MIEQLISCRRMAKAEFCIKLREWFTKNLRNKKVTPESLFEALCISIDKIRTVYDGKLFICKIPSRLELAFVDSKIARCKDILSLGLYLSNVLLIKTIDRELKFFNCDGLHLDKRKGCVALAGIILSSLYSIPRPLCKKAAGRPGPSSRQPCCHLKCTLSGGMGVGLGLNLAI